KLWGEGASPAHTRAYWWKTKRDKAQPNRDRSSLSCSPEDRVPEQLHELGAFKQSAMVAHEDIEITRLVMRVRPYHGMIAPHLDHVRGDVARLIDRSQYIHIGPRRLAPGVPFLLLDHERLRQSFGERAGPVFDPDDRPGEVRYVLQEANASQKLRE